MAINNQQSASESRGLSEGSALDTEQHSFFYHSCKWEREKSEEFKNNFDDEDINDLRNTIRNLRVNELDDSAIDHLSNRLKLLFVESSKKCNLYRELNSNKCKAREI